MSQTSNSGEEGEHGDSVAEEFEFYFPFAKTLALDLASPEDTSIAAAWVQKLEVEPESQEEKQTRLNYLKLLLFTLQRGRLSGIFRKQPPNGSLQPFPQGMSVLDMGNLMLDQDDMPSCGEGDARCVPYTIEISNDLREFVASQEVPYFGIQMYYAWSSDEPVYKWSAFDEDKFPQIILDKIEKLKEIKSDDKTTILKNKCPSKKNIRDFVQMDKCSKRRVKTPQEIESSQGRSFHTYMGLVGQMGNFDKCEESLGRLQRQDPRMGRSPKGRIVSGTGGENQYMHQEECFDNAVKGLGGFNIQNRVIFCSCPSQQANNCPDNFANGGPQPFEDHGACGRNNACNDRPESGNALYATAANRPPSRQYNTEQCVEKQGVPDGGFNQQMPQRRTPSPHPKSPTSNRVNNCPQQDNAGGCANEERVCVCSSPPCTCPCPRESQRQPSSAPCGGRVSASNQGGEGSCGKRKNYLHTSQEAGPSGVPPDQCVQDYEGRLSIGKSKRPQVLHCYDAQNPDPKIVQQFGTPATGAPCQMPDGTLKATQQRPQMYTTPSMGQRPSPHHAKSPYLGGQPVSGAPQQCSPKQQAAISSQQYAQNFQDCENVRPQQMQAGLNEPCARPPHDPFSPANFATRRRKGPCGSDGPHGGPRMDDMIAMLQEIQKMKTLHREKCDQGGSKGLMGAEGTVAQGQSQSNACVDQVPSSGPAQSNFCSEAKPSRSPACAQNAGAFNNGVCMKQQAAQGKAASKPNSPILVSGRGTKSLPIPSESRNLFACQRPQLSSSQPVQPCSRPCTNVPQDVCDADEEDNDESESSSESGCQEYNVPNYDMQTCPQQKTQGRTPQQVTYNVEEMPCAAPQGGMSGKQKVCTTLWSGAGNNVSPKGNQGQIQEFEGRLNMQQEMPQNVCPGRTPKQAQFNYGECDGMNVRPKMINLGNIGPQNQHFFAQQNMQNVSPRKPSPGKGESFVVPKEWEELPSSISQMPDLGEGPSPKGRRKPGPEGGQVGRKKIQGKECNDWYDMAGQGQTTGAGQSFQTESDQTEESGGQPCPTQKTSPKKSSKKATENCDESLTTTTTSGSASTRSTGPPTFFPIQYLLGGTNEQPAPVRQGSPQPATVRQGSPQPSPVRQGTPQQVCMRQGTPQQVPMRQGTPQQVPMRQGTPQQVPMRQGTPQQVPMRQGTPQSVLVRQNDPQTCPPQATKLGSHMQGEGRVGTPQNVAALKLNARSPPSKNKLVRQKSNPKQTQTITNSKSNPIPSKSEVRNNVKSKNKSKTTTNVKSGTPTNIKPEVANSKSKTKAKTKPTFKCVPKDFSFQTKRKTPQQLSLTKQSHVKCYTPEQMADLKNYVVQMNDPDMPRCEGNPYVEQSLIYQMGQSPGMKYSSPVQWKGAISHGSFSDITEVNPFDSCDFDPNDQIQQECDDDDNNEENYEFIPLFSMNADCNGANLFNQLVPNDGNAECQQPPSGNECGEQPQSQQPTNQEQQPRAYYQTFQADDFYDDCYNQRGYY